MKIIDRKFGTSLYKIVISEFPISKVGRPKPDRPFYHYIYIYIYINGILVAKCFLSVAAIGHVDSQKGLFY